MNRNTLALAGVEDFFVSENDLWVSGDDYHGSVEYARVYASFRSWRKLGTIDDAIIVQDLWWHCSRAGLRYLTFAGALQANCRGAEHAHDFLDHFYPWVSGETRAGLSSSVSFSEAFRLRERGEISRALASSAGAERYLGLSDEDWQRFLRKVTG